MTVSTTEFYKVYIAAAAQTVFPYTFRILEASHLKAYKNGVSLAYGVDYLVSGAGAMGGGSLTLIMGATEGDLLIVRRETPLTQGTTLGAAQMYSEADIEAMADKLTMIAQETASAFIPLSPAGYYIRINATGTGYEAVASLALGAAMPFDTGAAPPTSGTFAAGHFRLRVPSAAGESMGWSCPLGGTPGVWYEAGFVSANPV